MNDQAPIGPERQLMPPLDPLDVAPNGVPWRRYFPWWEKREEARALPQEDRLQYLIDFLSDLPAPPWVNRDRLFRFIAETPAVFCMTMWCYFDKVFEADYTSKNRVAMLPGAAEFPEVCGTAGCAAGWTVMLFSDATPMELFASKGAPWASFASDLLGIDREYGYYLFVASSDDGEDAVLRSLKHLRDHGVPLGYPGYLRRAGVES